MTISVLCVIFLLGCISRYLFQGRIELLVLNTGNRLLKLAGELEADIQMGGIPSDIHAHTLIEEIRGMSDGFLLDRISLPVIFHAFRKPKDPRPEPVPWLAPYRQEAGNILFRFLLSRHPVVMMLILFSGPFSKRITDVEESPEIMDRLAGYVLAHA